jgi:ribonucleoside-diphosphate reductase alpha chain
MISAWKTGEPGISYQTNMNNGNMNPHLNMEVYGNPCHEYVNIPYSSCNLASILLNKCTKEGKLDKKLLKENVQITLRFIDDMISVNKLPLPKYRKLLIKLDLWV